MLRIRDTLAEQSTCSTCTRPMTPVVCVTTLAYAKCPVVATWHAAGDLGWMRGGLKVWGFLIDRIDARIAVSRSAAESAEALAGVGFEIVPNGVVLPESVDPENRLHHVVFIGRHDTRKGLPVLLAAWPEIRRRTGARLRLIGTDPLQYRLLPRSRMRGSTRMGSTCSGSFPMLSATTSFSTAKVFVSPALGGESFGMVLVEAFAMATPVVASNIQGFADVAGPDAAMLVPPGETAALANAVVDVPRRRRAQAGDGPRRNAPSPWSATPGRTSHGGSTRIYQRVAA